MKNPTVGLPPEAPYSGPHVARRPVMRNSSLPVLDRSRKACKATDANVARGL